RAAVGRIAAPPGLSHLDRRDAAVDAAVSAFLDPTRRHQRRQATEALPVLVDRAWRLLRGAAADGRFDPAIGRELRDMFAPLQELLHPMMVEARHEQRQVWLRAARAEAALATDAMSIPAALAAMERGVESNRERIVDAISVELRRMQEIVNEANASAIVARAAADRIVEDARAETARAQSDAATARAEAAAAQSDAASAQSDAATARAEAAAAQSDAASAPSDAANARAEPLAAQSDVANARAEALEAQSDAANARAEALEAQSDAAGARAEVAARQRDLELLRYEKGQLQEIAREFDRVVHSRSWRLTRPLRGVARLLRGELRASLKPLHSPQATPAMPAIPAMQEVAVTVDAAPPAPPAAAFPAPVRLSAPAAEQGELPDVFIWS